MGWTSFSLYGRGCQFAISVLLQQYHLLNYPMLALHVPKMFFSQFFLMTSSMLEDRKKKQTT
jgi:hypothetical protein